MGCQGSEVVVVHVSRGRGLGECLRFLEKVKSRIKQFNTYFTTYKTKTTERWIKAWTAFSLMFC